MATERQIARLERREVELEEKIKRRGISGTEAQILAARGHNGRPQEPDYEDDRSKWSASQLQAFAARGVRPRSVDVDVADDDD